MIRMISRFRHSLSTLLLSLPLVLIGGCNTVSYEKGALWCNDPLKYETGVHFDDRHLNVARKGYIYVLAAAYVLQGNSDESKDHWFNLPARLKEVDRPEKDTSGFEVRTFELRAVATDQDPSEIIIAFTGSNDSADWIFTNLLFSRVQYNLAQAYVHRIANRYPGKRLVVTGFSLGAALAGHVTKDEKTSRFIHEAWLFNPSPKLYANDSYDKRIWIGALRGEALHYVRGKPTRLIWPGVNRIGAPWQQDAQDYYLISAFPIYGHYRWALARNILFVADYAHLQNPIGPVDQVRRNEPREILEMSSFKACERETAWRNHILSGQRAAQEAVSEKAKQAEIEANPTISKE
ncbi:MAG: hypothetical protein K2X55_10115 [Burkholderiaceae bacterium]|nr:hypothetical protein [Burkholderiaceae bacterium]